MAAANSTNLNKVQKVLHGVEKTIEKVNLKKDEF